MRHLNDSHRGRHASVPVVLSQQSQRPPGAEMPGPFPPDLHDVRHLWLKAGLLLLWALVSFGTTYFARDLQSLVWGGWPLGYWIASQGAVLVFIGIVVAYGWAMNRFQRQDAERQTHGAGQPPPVDGTANPHGRP